MSFAMVTDIGAFLKTLTGIRPAAYAAGTTNGEAIDRLGYQSCVVQVSSGAVAGGPSAQTLDAKLQESADGSTGWADVAGAAITQITTADTDGKVSVSLVGVKRYIRVVQTVGFTGGTSPTIGAQATVVLGGAVEKPAA